MTRIPPRFVAFVKGTSGSVKLAFTGSMVSVKTLPVSAPGRYSMSPPSNLASDRDIERTAPEVAVISVGRRNRYGHPAPAVLERLDRLGARVVRTDLHGTVRIRARRDGSYTVHYDSTG